jgi:hypothetical protein
MHLGGGETYLLPRVAGEPAKSTIGAAARRHGVARLECHLQRLDDAELAPVPLARSPRRGRWPAPSTIEVPARAIC